MMDVAQYLRRINSHKTHQVCVNTLQKLHECHLMAIPFENLDINSKEEISLEITHLYRKVVINKRGGFCYELNWLFANLLHHMGFKARLISARIFDNGVEGPEFDHMALIVTVENQQFLADVGFGDLFVRPVRLDEHIRQSDERDLFTLNRLSQNSYLLSVLKDGKVYEKKYAFDLKSRSIEEFHSQCQFKQFSPDSYFVKNLVVTKPTKKGRITVFNSELIKTERGKKIKVPIKNQQHLNKILISEFGINAGHSLSLVK